MNPISEEVKETTIFSGDHVKEKLGRTSLAYRNTLRLNTQTGVLLTN